MYEGKLTCTKWILSPHDLGRLRVEYTCMRNAHDESLYLCFCEVECQCQVEPFAHGEIARVLKLVFQRDELFVSEGCSRSTSLAAAATTG